MDYPFYIRSISRLPKELVDHLTEVALRQDYGPHPHFSSRQPVTSVISYSTFTGELGEALSPLLDLIPMPKSNIIMSEINLLKAGDALKEHSDITAQNGKVGAKVIVCHKVHIPLQTNPDVLFGHRRSRKQEIEWAPMEAGYAYAYNNYVLHSVVNNSLMDRYQLTIRYDDPDWSIRQDLLKRLGITAFDSYECPVHY